MLARAYMSRSEEAEARGARLRASYYNRRVRLYDDGRFSAAMVGEGTITLTTEPGGGTARRVVRRGLVWKLGETRALGETPLRAQPLGTGSWVLTLDHPACEPASYPVYLDRGAHWKREAAVPLLPVGHADPDRWLYVPAGTFRSGADSPASLPERDQELPGFLIGRFPITAAEFAEMGGGAPAGDPRLPVVGVTWAEADQYARWRGERDGAACELPTLLQWEKAARGVDGRVYPWGDRFGAMLCRVRAARAGAPAPAPVGACADDASVYGVRDLAGGVREWCAAQPGGDPRSRPTRGGDWKSGPAPCAAAMLEILDADSADDRTGFRLVRDLTPS
jgi:serine/threonine-protein kinase